MRAADLEPVYAYHDGTKHHFDRFARSLGYLDWASQPRPFRAYAGAPLIELDRDAPAGRLAAVTYDELFASDAVAPTPITLAAIGHLLRHALGLSAWKVLGPSRWPLRVNPSSGNLHPTEAYVVTGPLPDLPDRATVWHYAPDRHALEQRCAFAADEWRFRDGEGSAAFLIALTSIHWRESWKYGERGFRYCQHDLGHAIGALSIAAAMSGWTVSVQSGCSHDWISTLIGIDRDPDYVDAEREDAGCLLLVSQDSTPLPLSSSDPLADAARRGHWSGQASQLSEDHVQWTFIDEVAAATRDGGQPAAPDTARATDAASAAAGIAGGLGASRPISARALVLQRRSAVALDGLSSLDAETFFRMLARVLPGTRVPWTRYRGPRRSTWQYLSTVWPASTQVYICCFVTKPHWRRFAQRATAALNGSR